MIGALATGVLLTAGYLPVGDAMISPEDFRRQAIHKTNGEKNWPFVADKGTLLCIKLLGELHVYFAPDDGETRNRVFNIDVDLMKMAMVNLGMTGVLRPFEKPEDLLKRLVPFVTMGQRLCNQQAGTSISGTEL